jgi:Concanavalin A-like lectin/glucanases superfamily
MFAKRTWITIFTTLVYVGAFGIVVYYLKPDLLTSEKVGFRAPIVLAVGIYALIWVLLLLYYNLFEKPDSAVIEGIWEIAPTSAGAMSYSNGKMVPTQGKADLLSESDAMMFLSESFTFAFFVSVDNSTIELVSGDNLKKPYQNLLVVPGAFNIAVDPLHESLRIQFVSFNTEPYEVVIPTLQSKRWHQIAISIEGRTADIYQNGTLLKSVALPNVIAGRPGKPFVYMNSDMYARLAYVQAWPSRLKEVEVVNNYRWNSDGQGIPPMPSPASAFVFGVPNFNFCVGSFCLESLKPKENALTYVDYTYA